MAPEEIQDLVQDFTAKATAVNAVVQELPNMAAALQYVVDVCENKAPCELMADEDVEKGSQRPQWCAHPRAAYRGRPCPER